MYEIKPSPRRHSRTLIITVAVIIMEGSGTVLRPLVPSLTAMFICHFLQALLLLCIIIYLAAFMWPEEAVGISDRYDRFSCEMDEITYNI